ncbi:hypothetical protein D3C75_1278480 [compost metagenome]
MDTETEELEHPEDYRFRLSVLTYGFRYLEMAEKWLDDLRGREASIEHYADQGPAAEEDRYEQD